MEDETRKRKSRKKPKRNSNDDRNSRRRRSANAEDDRDGICSSPEVGEIHSDGHGDGENIIACDLELELVSDTTDSITNDCSNDDNDDDGGKTDTNGYYYKSFEEKRKYSKHKQKKRKRSKRMRKLKRKLTYKEYEYEIQSKYLSFRKKMKKYDRTKTSYPPHCPYENVKIQCNVNYRWEYRIFFSAIIYAIGIERLRLYRHYGDTPPRKKNTRVNICLSIFAAIRTTIEWKEVQVPTVRIITAITRRRKCREVAVEAAASQYRVNIITIVVDRANITNRTVGAVAAAVARIIESNKFIWLRNES